MKKSHKKRKKKGSQKAPHSRPKAESVSIEESKPTIVEEAVKPKDRQVISRSGQERDVKAGNVILNYINIAIQFLKDSRTELRKVKWPNRKELLATTTMVIVFAIAVALFLGLIDLGLVKVISMIVG
jgi:preprotein translocase subunit SecE